MKPQSVQIVAPSRLHFGLLSFGNARGRQFGGIGTMIAEPALRLRVTSAHNLEASGSLAERALEFARRWRLWATERGVPRELGCKIEIHSSPPEHSGLGSGTQLGLAIAAALNALHNLPPQQPPALAMSVGRGERSAIGTYGFAKGGLLIEAGKLPGEAFSPLIARVELPEGWRLVLVLSPTEQGLFGQKEQAAFAKLPPVPEKVTAYLSHEILLHMLPAAQQGDFARFSQSLYRYGHAAGMCFAPHQHGAFASERIARLVTTIRELGTEGVGQSSWGPTIFALTPSAVAADELVAKLRSHVDERSNVLIVELNRRGAELSVQE